MFFNTHNHDSSRNLGNITDPINAEANVLITAPDSITSFHLTAVSMNDVYGLGLTEKFTTLKVFQDFFIVMTLPHHCKRTEIVTLPIRIFSYLPSDQSVTLSVARNDAEFTVMKPSVEGWTSKSNDWHFKRKLNLSSF
jgi:hypothetical protein